MKAPRVSVVMPVHNREWCVGDAIASVLATGEPELEVVVVDDGSTDGTARLVADWMQREPKRVRAISHPRRANRGIAASRNLGVAHARGRYLAFLDSDDLFLPCRFASSLRWLDDHPASIACVEPFDVLDMRTGERETVTHLTALPPQPRAWVGAMLFQSVYWRMPAITLRRAAFDSFGGFDARLPVGEEIALWLKLAATGRVGSAQRDESVAVVRRHDSHSWSGVGRTIEHSVYLDILHDFSSWGARHRLPADLRAMTSERMRQSLVEVLLDDAVPRMRRVSLWASSALRSPRTAFHRRTTANLGRLVLGLPQWK